MGEPIPETMTAIEIREPGGPEVLVPASRPRPDPGPGEVLVQVAAAGVNRPDVLQRLGGYPPPPGASDIPGLEIAGRIVALGQGVTAWTPGEEVTALVTGGGYAEYCAAPAVQCLPVPKGLGLAEAAAMAARRASGPPRSSSPGRSAPGSSPPPARPTSAAPARISAPSGRSTTGTRISWPWSRRRPAGPAWT